MADPIPTLGSIRISRLDDASTGPERQDTDLQAVPGVRYVHIARDLDVSAYSVHPLKRPGLGPWLTDPQKVAQYDQLIVWKLDRFCRSNADMRSMLSWADEHNKRLVFLKDALTYDPRAEGLGRIVNDVIISFVAAMAEMESFNTSVRTGSLHALLRKKKSWKGGSLPLGYTVRKEADRKVLVPHPETQRLLHEIADKIISGLSDYAISAELNSRGELAPSDWSRVLQGREPKGVKWHGKTVRELFLYDTCLGYSVKREVVDGVTVRVTRRDEDGRPLQFWEPLMSVEKLAEVRSALASRSTAKRPHVSRASSPLRGVAVCYSCGANLSYNRDPRGKQSGYLRCYNAVGKGAKCSSSGSVPVDVAWGYLADFFLYHEGSKRVTEGRYVVASAGSAQLEQLTSEFSAVSAQAARAQSQAARDRLQARLDELDAAMAALEGQRASSGHWEATELSETYSERWQRLDAEGRREMAIRAGYKLRIRREPGTNFYEVEVQRP